MPPLKKRPLRPQAPLVHHSLLLPVSEAYEMDHAILQFLGEMHLSPTEDIKERGESQGPDRWRKIEWGRRNDKKTTNK